MNAHTIPVRADTGCRFCEQYSRLCDCEEREAEEEARANRTTEDRRDAWNRAVALIDAMPKREPSELEHSRARADDAVRSLIAPIIGDGELEGISRDQKRFLREMRRG